MAMVRSLEGVSALAGGLVGIFGALHIHLTSPHSFFFLHCLGVSHSSFRLWHRLPFHL